MQASSIGSLAPLCAVVAALGFGGCAASSRAPLPPSQLAYVVHRGDTLYDIAGRFGLTIDAVSEFNDLDDPDELAVGQVIFLPDDGVRTFGLVNRPPRALAFSPSIPRPDRGLPRIDLQYGAQYLGALLLPVQGARGSAFGWRDGRFHEGMDIKAPEGTPIRAAHAGLVAYSGRGLSGFGNLIVVRAPDNHIATVYAHNDENLVDAGDTVERGEVIARVGMTGRASGPHLHFEVRVLMADGKKAAVDPQPFLAPRS